LFFEVKLEVLPATSPSTNVAISQLRQRRRSRARVRDTFHSAKSFTTFSGGNGGSWTLHGIDKSPTGKHVDHLSAMVQW